MAIGKAELEIVVTSHVICNMSLWQILKMRMAGVKETDVDKLIDAVTEVNTMELNQEHLDLTD